MLGTFLICDFKRGLNYRDTGLPLGVEGACPPGFSRRLLWQDQHSHLSCTTREHYPVFACENDDFLVHLEGHIYQRRRSPVGHRTLSLIHNACLLRSKPARRPCLTRWLLEVDGDFLLVLVHKADGGIAVINDVFGRLPTYVHLRDGCLILSRDLRRLTQVLGAADFDRMALAQYLLLGFPLGNRSWFAGIEYLEPASLITISPAQASIKVTRLHEFNLEGEEHRNRSATENASNLAGLFRQACRQRAGGAGENVVSLSGGLDSRAVAAGLRREEIPFTAATFLNSLQTNAADVRVAARVAESLGVEWQLFHLRPPGKRPGATPGSEKRRQQFAHELYPAVFPPAYGEIRPWAHLLYRRWRG